MKRKKVAVLATVLAMVAALGISGTALAAPAEAVEYDLFAGQDIDVGSIFVWNDATDLYVEIDLDPGWCMTESHVQAAADADLIPQKNGNPIPGQFAQGDTYIPCADGDTFSFPLSEVDDDPVIAVHAKVRAANVVATGPSWATNVNGSAQGLRLDGTLVLPERSNAENALVQDYTGTTNAAGTPGFYSLGFGGSITVGFDCKVLNGDGTDFDLSVFEVTNGTYPQESADVYISKDGVTFYPVGTADNLPGGSTIRSDSFDAGSLEWFKFVKVVDTTDAADFGPWASYSATTMPDGYDLDGIQALQDCVEFRYESAWGATDGPGTTDFPGANWATYIEHTLQSVLVETVIVPATDPEGVSSLSSLELGKGFEFRVSGTWTNRNGADGVDAACTREGAGLWATAAAGYPDDLLELQPDTTDVAWDPVGTTTVPGCADGHEYTLSFTGTGAAVGFRIYDGEGNVQNSSWFGDNAGSLTVEIWQTSF